MAFSSFPLSIEVLYMRPAGGQWGWCYIDHEAMRWRDVTMTYDAPTDTVIVTERGIRRAALDRQRGMFWIDKGDFSRELPAPQDHRQPEFAFRQRAKVGKPSGRANGSSRSRRLVPLRLSAASAPASAVAEVT